MEAAEGCDCPRPHTGRPTARRLETPDPATEASPRGAGVRHGGRSGHGDLLATFISATDPSLTEPPRHPQVMS